VHAAQQLCHTESALVCGRMSSCQPTVCGECAFSSVAGNSGSSLEQYTSLNFSFAGISKVQGVDETTPAMKLHAWATERRRSAALAQQPVQEGKQTPSPRFCLEIGFEEFEYFGVYLDP
jgi:hypothetical protein